MDGNDDYDNFDDFEQRFLEDNDDSEHRFMEDMELGGLEQVPALSGRVLR